MEQYVIKGGNPLVGEVEIAGAKNAALAILAAAIMTDETILIENLPDVRDINVLLEAIAGIGAQVDRIDKSTVKINGSTIGDVSVDYEYIKKIRASSGVGDITHYCDGAEEFRKAVRQEVAAQADFIKIYASGSAFSPTGVPKHPIMTIEEIRTAVNTARANGLYVAAHCHADSAIRDCVQAGVRTIEHATYLGEATTDLLLASEDSYLVPTLAAMYVSQTDPQERSFWLSRLTPMLEDCAKAIGYAYRAGVLIGFGTDSAPMSPQYDTGVEFRFRREYCGMENMDILLQATKNSAQIAGLSDVGEIKPGMKADLILVDGDPVAELSAMYVPPVQVWKNGIARK